jgi:hypothetical protein
MARRVHYLRLLSYLFPEVVNERDNKWRRKEQSIRRQRHTNCGVAFFRFPRR